MENEKKGRKKSFAEDSIVLSIRVPKSKLEYYKGILKSMLLSDKTKS